MGRIVIGIVIALVAVGLCWVDVYLWQTHGADWVPALLGAERSGNAALVETTFNLGVFVPLILVAIVAAAVERRNAAALGRKPLSSLAVGLIVGLAGLAVSFAYSRLSGSVSGGGSGIVTSGLLAWGMAAVALQTGAEEIYFRGWLQAALVARWGRWPGIIAGALCFAALHVAGGARAPVALANLFLGGMMFGLLAYRTGGIAAALGTHWAWNGAEQLLVGVDPNPGIGSFGSVFDYELVGSAIWGGSAEGLNTSVGMTAALLAILAPLVLIGWRQSAASEAAVKPPVPATPAAPAFSSSARPG